MSSTSFEARIKVTNSSVFATFVSYGMPQVAADAELSAGLVPTWWLPPLLEDPAQCPAPAPPPQLWAQQLSLPLTSVSSSSPWSWFCNPLLLVWWIEADDAQIRRLHPSPWLESQSDKSSPLRVLQLALGLKTQMKQRFMLNDSKPKIELGSPCEFRSDDPNQAPCSDTSLRLFFRQSEVGQELSGWSSWSP